MSDFSADWLALRGTADTRARDPGLAARLAGHFRGRNLIRVLDLGAGTGANLRATAIGIDVPQHWVLTDHDPNLLARVQPVPDTTIERRTIDLSGDLSGLFDPAPALVTGSAFLDLCSAAWMARLVDHIVDCGAALYAVLSYDGREIWEPDHPLDAAVLSAFHSDQRRDKGLGPAMGPGASEHLAELLRDRDYHVREAPSDWVLTRPRDAELIAALAAGTATAVAATIGPDSAAAWRAARARAHRVTIGHRDLLALPAG